MPVIEFLQGNPLAFYLAAAAVGLAIGSFLNVVAHRLPLMLEREWRRDCRALLNLDQPAEPEQTYNLVTPRSRCPHCGHRITAMENIPVISWLFLRGRCSACRAPISLRYPVIELLTGILSAVTAWRFGVSAEAGCALLLTWSLVVLAAIDLDRQILPDAITLPLLWLGILCSMFNLFTDVYSSLWGAIGGYLVFWTVYQLFRLMTGKEGMGYGDFKLLALLGAWLGWQMLPLVIILSSLAGAVIGTGLILLVGRERGRPIPFGPFLAAAGWVALIWGPQLTTAYIRWAVNA